MGLNLLRTALVALVLTGSASPVGAADSDLLNSVKRNPEKAKAMCRSFRQMNADGKSAYSKKATRMVAESQNLTFQDAEILVTYVVGMHCPNVRREGRRFQSLCSADACRWSCAAVTAVAPKQ